MVVDGIDVSVEGSGAAEDSVTGMLCVDAAGASPEHPEKASISKAAMKESPDALLSKLNSEDRAKVQDLLNDRAALEKILKSDAARAIMEGLMKKGK